MNARDFLNRLKWDSRYDIGKFNIIILHRGAPNNRRKIPCKNIELGRSFFSTRETRIPYHRILEIRKGNKIVWKKVSFNSHAL